MIMSANMNAPPEVSSNIRRTDSVTRAAIPPNADGKESVSSVYDAKTAYTALSVNSKIPLPNSKVVATDAVTKEGQNIIKEEDVSQVVVNLNNYVQNTQRSLNFSVDDETGRTVIKVIDTETQETIRQIPSEEIVALAQKMLKNIGNKGYLFETEV